MERSQIENAVRNTIKHVCLVEHRCSVTFPEELVGPIANAIVKLDQADAESRFAEALRIVGPADDKHDSHGITGE